MTARSWRAIQNIGGMANCTILPPLISGQGPLAFDSGPGNALIDWAAEQASAGRDHYDRGGALAASGRVNEEWLQAMLAEPYFARVPPKSTGVCNSDN